MENIEACSKTKSVLSVLGPIANQVVELKTRQGIVCDASTVMNLLKQCQALESSCALLATRLSAYALAHRDDMLTTEAKKLKTQLEKIAVSLTDVTRDLHRGDVGVRDNEDVWADIVEDTEQLLSILTEALLAWDKAQIRRISKAVTFLQQALSRLHETRSIQRLPEDFQEVVAAVGELLSLVEVRCGDLYRRAQRETVRLLSLQLCHTMPLLASACAATVTNPLSKHVKMSRELVSGRLQTLLGDLNSQLGLGDQEYDLEEPGAFIACVDKTLEMLIGSQEKCSEASEPVGPLSNRVKPLLEEVLRHAIAVAYCSVQDDNKLIMAMCENVLKQLKILVSLEREGTPDSVDVQISCDILADCVELLEQKVNTALIRLIATTFATPLAPLQSMTAMLTSEKDGQCRDQNALDPLVADFDLHVDRIFQIGGFATACTSDIARVRIIRDSLQTLEWLEGCLVPAIVTAYTDPHPNAYGHALMLVKHWMASVTQLQECLDLIMDPSAFSLVTKQEVHRIWAGLKEKLYTQDVTWIKKQVDSVVNYATRLLSLHQRDNFLTHFQAVDLQVAVNEVKSSMASLSATPTDLSRHRSMIKRVQLTLTLLSRLASSLNEDNLNPEDDLNEFNGRQNSGAQNKVPKLSATQKQQLLTSDIRDIPVDVATPASRTKSRRATDSPQPSTSSDQNSHQQQQKPLTRFSKSMSRLGEVRARAGGSNMSGHHSRSMQAIASETLGCDTSIDITKFLSRSTNTLPPSARSSRRNFSLKVKEINLDIDGAINKATLPPHPSGNSGVAEDGRRDPKNKGAGSSSFKTSPLKGQQNTTALREVSDLISQEDTVSHNTHRSIGDEISGILENLTSLAGSMSALAAPSSPPSAGKKRKCTWEHFGGDKENRGSTTSLHGIKLQNASFNPQFPEIRSSESSEVIFDEKTAQPTQEETPRKSGGGFLDLSIWKDFTAILEKKTPMKSNYLNFSNNFSNWQCPGASFSFSTFGKGPPEAAKAPDRSQSVADLSDTPFLAKDADHADSLSGNQEESVRLSSSSYSISPSSATFGTPQRLKDLHLVHQRLAAIKNSIR
ncbi:uncharacterized protein LOC134785444 [Penaeus indicus]|uniref:uncharacterized protein LOC134785444 n=1 Tax=Penaeus indicus TaxID=29960 RepID=UPI00300CCFFF